MILFVKNCDLFLPFSSVYILKKGFLWETKPEKDWMRSVHINL